MNTEKKICLSGIVLGIVGIIFSLICPAVSYSCSVPGLIITSEKKKNGFRTTASLVLNIVSLACAFANSVIAVIIAAGGYFKKHKGEF